ncbi:adenylate kinase family protein [Methanohalophilus mahii]|uniref:Putative adenylate kinase n=1 Tax=Methanohalophilus mahii (strain ATCC 35705 / DSM 5219 / SLP) TaxID=547558 RepID=D5E767_METMS|nr:adenylate kinase family protein [Methanohalophilus mahii]ADE37005.1 Adenylate kinase [Methanohalophilus mahii DSM 5219]
MFIALTGTPGCGKTSVSRLLENEFGYRVVHLNELIRSENLFVEEDKQRDCVVTDLDVVKKRLSVMEESEKPVIIDSHMAHLIADVSIVLRTAPNELKNRLEKRGYQPAKVDENIEAECLDVILVESVENCEMVFEIGTTDRSISEVGGDVREIIDGISSGHPPIDKFKPGSFDWSGEIF